MKTLISEYAREMRSRGECYLLVSGDAMRICSVLPAGTIAYRFWRRNPRFGMTADPQPEATDEQIAQWFAEDVGAIGMKEAA